MKQFIDSLIASVFFLILMLLGETLQGFPYNQMHHYVNKITACYQTYQRLYAGQ